MRGASTIVFAWTEIGRAHEPIRARRACENASLRARHFDGGAGGLAAFLASAVVYESLVLRTLKVAGAAAIRDVKKTSASRPI